ncbi:MAG: hypothetical protein AAGF88_10970 [Pseudomonadota bacterium]
MHSSILDAFESFDGRHVSPLRALIEGDPDVARIFEHVPGPHEVAASWVLKALAERGQMRDAELAGFLVRLSLLSEPDAILHLLQCAQYTPVAVARAMRDDLVPLYRHPRGLVRVWAFDAYIRGAEHPAELADTTERIRQGLADRQAAMRARARGLASELQIEV